MAGFGSSKIKHRVRESETKTCQNKTYMGVSKNRGAPKWMVYR